jgi:hypothetical protein
MEKGDAVKVIKGPYKGKNGTLLKPSRALGPGWIILSDREELIVLNEEIKKA